MISCPMARQYDRLVVASAHHRALTGKKAAFIRLSTLVTNRLVVEERLYPLVLVQFAYAIREASGGD